MGETRPPAPPVGRWDASIVRYPDPAVQVLDPRFEKYRLQSLYAVYVNTQGAAGG